MSRSVQDAFKAGFHGYLTKQTDTERFTHALAERRGRPDGVPAAEDSGGTGVATGDELLAEQLTTREVEVLQLLAEGASSGHIAEQLSRLTEHRPNACPGDPVQAAGPLTARGRGVRRTPRSGETPHLA